MGAKSSSLISKHEALGHIVAWLHDASDDALANVLEILNDDRREQGYDDSLGLLNFRIDNEI